MMHDFVYGGVRVKLAPTLRSRVLSWLKLRRVKDDLQHQPPVDPLDDETVERLEAALAALPEHSRAEIRSRLIQVAVTFERTADIAPLVEFIDSVVVTARLHSNPRYVAALEEAEAEPWEPSVPIEDAIEMARERWAAAGRAPGQADGR